MSANVSLLNWQQYAQSNFTWQGELYYPTSTQAYKIWLGSRFAMTGTWPIEFSAGQDGYDDYINAFIHIRFWNQVGALVTDLGKWPCWIKNGGTYTFDCVTHVLAEVSQPYAGYIYSKVLTHDSAMDSIPVSAVALNAPALIHVVAGNSGSVDELFSLSYVVSRPDGSIAQSFADQSGYVSPGGFYTFGGNQFSLNAAGTWTINIILSVWTGSAWVQVDSYQGNLCTVQAAVFGAPTLISPANGATVPGTSVTLKWSVVPYATLYIYEVFKGGNAFAVGSVQGVTQVDIPGLLNDGASYTWFVVAYVDIMTGPSAQSVTWTFSNGPVAQPSFTNLQISYNKV